jgi:3-isopropylmalate/(R)-2-methylmalate dehydratase large subunit
MLDKVWDEHVVVHGDAGAPDLLYVDVHLLHEITSPQAFEGLRAAGRDVRRPDLTIAVEDHNVSTDGQGLISATPAGREGILALRDNSRRTGVRLASIGEPDQGIVHVIGPELGLSQPGCLVVCGDSHTSTHGALGCLAFGIGTSEVEHVLATQTVRSTKPRAMRVTIEGTLRNGVSAKDVALLVVHTLGTGGGQGHAIEYAGSCVASMSMEQRMTLCNMSIEAGAKVAMVAPDEITFAYLRGRTHAPKADRWDDAVTYWSSFRADPDAAYDAEVTLDVTDLTPFVTWGTNPGQSAPLSSTVPDPASYDDPALSSAAERALDYMGLSAGQRLTDIEVDRVFVGSCTNARLSDLETVADVLRGRHVSDHVRMLIVPGSAAVKRQAEERGLDQVFRAAGAEWRDSGCSMCVGLNADRAAPGERVASTSNRNFEGRQGDGARTHLVSPAVAAATAVRGRLSSPADLTNTLEVLVP